MIVKHDMRYEFVGNIMLQLMTNVVVISDSIHVSIKLVAFMGVWMWLHYIYRVSFRPIYVAI